MPPKSFSLEHSARTWDVGFGDGQRGWDVFFYKGHLIQGERVHSAEVRRFLNWRAQEEYEEEEAITVCTATNELSLSATALAA